MIEFEPDPELEWEVDSDMDVEILFTPENLPEVCPEPPEAA